MLAQTAHATLANGLLQQWGWKTREHIAPVLCNLAVCEVILIEMIQLLRSFSSTSFSFLRGHSHRDDSAFCKVILSEMKTFHAGRVLLIRDEMYCGRSLQCGSWQESDFGSRSHQSINR